MTKTAGFALTALAALLLAGCSATPAPSESDTPAAAPTASASPTASATPTPEPAAWSAPEECTAIDVSPGATVTGDELGACIQTALSSFGTGKETISGAELGGEIRFQYTPEFEFQGSLETGDGPIEITFLDGIMWIDSGDGPVKGDPESTDPDEQMAGITGELYRVFSDPSFAGDLIAASPSWTVASAPDSITLANGDTVSATRITSDAPFSWYDLPVQSYVVWFADDWTPVGSEGTASFFGASSTITQHYYDLGEPVEITPAG